MLKLFTDHPASVGETYGEHWRFATGTGLTLIGAGLACMVHGALPFLFTTTGSRIVRGLAARLAGVAPRQAARRLVFRPAERSVAMTAGMERPAVVASLNSAGL